MKISTKEKQGNNINYGLVMKEIRSNLEKLRNKEIIENEFADQLYKIVQREESTKERRHQFMDTINNAVWITDEVIKLALKETIAIISDIGYSDDVIADSLETIAEVLRLRGKNAIAAEDINGLDLFYDHRFEQIIEVFKYGLTPGNYISSRNIARILRALTTLEYKDLRLQEMVQQKLVSNRYLKESEIEDSLAAAHLTEDQLLDLPLLNKKGFYNKSKEALTDVTLSNKFNNYISYIINKFGNQNNSANRAAHTQKVSSEFIPKEMIELLEGISPEFKERNQPEPELKPDVLDPEEELRIKQVEEVTQALDYLKEVFNESKGALIHISDSILRLREIYGKLGELQKQDFVYENSSLMIDFMEVEELLIEAGVISITDIKALDKEGKVSKEIKRVGPLIRQLVHEFGGSTMVIEHLDQFVEEEKPEEQIKVKSEKGMYRNYALEAFSALVDYANLESRDVHLQRTYTHESYGKLINPEHDRELHVYKVEKRPLEALGTMYHDPLVDRRKLSVGRVPYLLSAKTVRDFVRKLAFSQKWNFLRSFPLTKENVYQLVSIASRLQSQELMNEIQLRLQKRNQLDEKHEFEIEFGPLVQSFMKNPNLAQSLDHRLELSDAAVLEAFLETASRYNLLTPSQKVDLIYNLALWGASSEVGSKAFTMFYKNLVNNANNIWELCTNQNNHWLPLPENLRKMHYVYFLAQGLGLPGSQGFDYLFNQIQMSARMNYGLKDTRDPVFNIVEDSLRNLLTDANYSSTQANLNSKFSLELHPLGEVVSSFGYNTVIYLRHLDMIGPNHSITNECEALSKIIQTYLTRVNKKPTVVVNIPYTAFLKDPHNHVSLELIEKEAIAESLSKMFQVLSVVDVSNTPTSNLIQINPVSKDFSQTHSFLKREPWSKIERLIEVSFTTLGSKQIPEEQRPVIEAIHELKASLFAVIQHSEKPSTRYIQAIKALKINIFLFHKRILSLPYSDLQEIFKVFEVVTETEFVNSLKKINKKLTEVVAETGLKEENTGKPIFLGRNQGLDMIDLDTSKQSKRFDFIEFFNYEYLSNPDFFSYSDWESEIVKSKPFFKHLRQSIGETATPYGYVNYGVIPQNIAKFDIARPSMFPLYWERQVFNFNAKLTEELNEFDRMIYPEQILEKGSDAETETNLKLALEKFKYDMKFKTNLRDQLDILFSTQLYNSILEKSLYGGSDSSKMVKRLTRTEKGYREFLERLQNERRTRSKFYRFAINQATKNDQLKYWRDVVYNKIPTMYRVVAS